MMDLRQDLCLRVLPSNAPSHYAIDECEILSPKGVLQERCGNRQDEYTGNDQLEYLKPESSVYAEGYTENLYSNGRQAGYHSRSSGRHYLTEEARKKREFKELSARLQVCPGYQKYRNKQPKASDADQKWPEHMERAFIMGKSSS